MIADGVAMDYSIIDQSNILVGTGVKTPNLKVAKNNFSALSGDWLKYNTSQYYQISNLRINQSVSSCDDPENVECIKISLT
jgi:hypothetical protein